MVGRSGRGKPSYRGGESGPAFLRVYRVVIVNLNVIRCHALQGCPSRSLLVLLLDPQVVEVMVVVLLKFGVD